MEQDEKPETPYQKPEIRDYGDLQDLTNATVSGTHVDVPYGTLVSDHEGVLDTFS